MTRALRSISIALAAVFLVSCSAGDATLSEPSTSEHASDSPTTSLPVTTDQAPTTSAAVASTVRGSTAEAVAVFNGEQCQYNGADEFPLNTTVAFSFTNRSENTEAGFSIWKVPDGRTTGDIVEHGILGIGTHLLTDMKATTQPSPPGSETRLEVTLEIQGSYAVNCFVPDNGTGADYPATVFNVFEG